MYRYLSIVVVALFLVVSCSKRGAGGTRTYEPEVFNPKWMAGEFNTNNGRFFLVGEQGSIIYSKEGSSWAYSNTPVLQTLHAIESNKTNSTLIAVGESATILRSTDNGESWEKANVKFPDSVEFSEIRLRTAIYDTGKSMWVAAGTHNAILFSDDDGKNWGLASYYSGDDKKEILDLFFEKESGDILFAAQDGTIGRSQNGGKDWEITEHDMDPIGQYIPHITAFYQFEKLLLATGDNGRLLVSKNAGEEWTLIKVPTMGYFSGSAYDPKHDSIILSTQKGEAVVSFDKGESWQVVTFDVDNWPGDEVPFMADVHFDAVSESLLMVGNSGVLARSIDGGRSWFADTYKPLFNMSVTTVLHNPAENTYVAAGLGGVIVKSKSLGLAQLPNENWEVVRPGIDLYLRHVINLPESDIFIAVGELGGVWRSQDDGKSWALIEVDYPVKSQPPHLRDIVWVEKDKSIIAAGPTGSVIRSSDMGLTWTAVFQGQIRLGEAFTQILQDKKSDSWLLSEVLYQTVYRSIDKGLTWENFSSINSDGKRLWHGAVSEKLGLILVVGQKGGIGISRDGGTNWQMAETESFSDLFGAFADESKGVLLAVGQNGVILRSTDGDKWQSVNSGTASTLRRVILDPVSGSYLALGQEGTIRRSVDGGLTWLAARKPDGNGELRTGLFEPVSKSLIVVGRDGTILQSIDSGASWKPLSAHTGEHLRSVAVNPRTGTLIAVGETLIRLGIK